MRALWARFRRRRRRLVALCALALLAALALGADLVASDLPLAVNVDGTTYWLPCVFRPPALAADTQASLQTRANWLWHTPVPFGPNQHVFESRSDAAYPPFGPDRNHLLGTDGSGRDVLARLIHGARVSLAVGFGSVALSLLLGLCLGLLAGYFGGWVDGLVSRLSEVMFVFPTVFFLIALGSVTRFVSVWPLVLSLGLIRWADIARLTRAETLKLQRLEFVLAAKAMGASSLRIMLTHLLPNALGPALVAATFSVGTAMLLESALSFLGLGVPAPTASWGELLTQAHRYLVLPGAWWLAVYPGLAIAGTVIAVSVVGEGLHDALGGRTADDTETA